LHIFSEKLIILIIPCNWVGPCVSV